MVDTITNARIIGNNMTVRTPDSHSMTAKTTDSNSMTARITGNNMTANNTIGRTAVAATSSSSHMITMNSKEEIILGKTMAEIITRYIAFN